MNNAVPSCWNVQGLNNADKTTMLNAVRAILLGIVVFYYMAETNDAR